MNATKAAFQGKFIALDTCIRKEERSQINDLNFHLQKLEKEKHIKTKVCKRKEIIKIRAEISEIENRKIIEKNMKPKPGSLRGSMKLTNLEPNSLGKKRVKTQKIYSRGNM